jgi:hypothetical protein
MDAAKAAADKAAKRSEWLHDEDVPQGEWPQTH